MKETYNLNDIVKTNNNEDEKFVLIEQYPDSGLTILYRNSSYEPWVVASEYDVNDSTWMQGEYFSTLQDAMKFVNNIDRPMYHIGNIEWETDDDEDLAELPDGVITAKIDDPDLAADYLSDEYGFLVKGFDIEKINPYKSDETYQI